MRQQGNFITVRQKPDQDGGWGSLLNPKPLELSLFNAVRVRTRLGYEAVPASEFWEFSTPSSLLLRVDRVSADRYACHVGVALLDADNRRVAPLVQSASGRGTTVRIEAGQYKVVASLGMAVAIKDLVLEFNTSVADSLTGVAAATVEGTAHLMTPEQARDVFLHGESVVVADGEAMLSVSSPDKRLVGEALVVADSTGRVLSGMRGMKAQATVIVTGQTVIRSYFAVQVKHLKGKSASAITGTLKTRQVLWVEEPDGAWRARVSATGAVELNRPYVSFAVDEVSLAALLARLQQELSP
jgi:hypothetical protein